MDLWIAGLLVRVQEKPYILDFKKNFRIGILDFSHMVIFA
jgi:hypothetical protein